MSRRTHSRFGVAALFSDLHVTITQRLAEVLFLETEKPTRRELAEAVADRASYERDSGKYVLVEKPHSSPAVALLVDVAEYVDVLVQERPRIASVSQHAERASHEAVPNGLTEIATCLAELGWGGTQVAAGPLGRVMRDALKTRIQSVAARLIRLVIEAGHLERA